MLAPRKLDSGRWQARYRDKKGMPRSAGTFATKKEAQQATATTVAAIVERRFDDGTRGTILFADFAAKALAIRSAQLAPRSLHNMEANVRLWLTEPFGQIRLRDITAEEVDEWWASLPETSGRRNAYMTLSGIMRLARKYQHVEVSPCQVERASRDVSKPRPELSEDDAWRLIAACDPDVRPFLTVLFGGALRLAEALDLDRKHLNMKTGVVTVEQQWAYEKGGSVIRHTTKTGEPRPVTLPGYALDALTEHLHRHPMLPSSPLFINPEGRRLSRNQVYRALAGARAETGLEWVHAHDLRHASLTDAMLKTGDLFGVMARAGHGDMRSAKRYQHVGENRDTAIASAMLRKVAGDEQRPGSASWGVPLVNCHSVVRRYANLVRPSGHCVTERGLQIQHAV